MTPGTYLEKRRLMAGYSLSSLARELLMLTGFGGGGSFGPRAESDFRRLRLTLISAEQDSLHHSRERIELIRAFVPLDPHLYLELVSFAEQGVTRRLPGLCQNCACSFHDPCVLPVDPAAVLGTSVCENAGTGVCSACEQSLARLTPRPASISAEAALEQGAVTIAEQLRELGERMRRLAHTSSEKPASTRAEPPFLRLIPTTGEN